MHATFEFGEYLILFHSESFFPSRIEKRRLKHKNIILPVVLYLRKMFCLTVRKKTLIDVF
jgi:hypothetical protein